MRVVAGWLGGRLFDSPSGHRTHPMSEKARGAIFNALGDISGLIFLDSHAGSGALSIEAISRGAASGVAVEINKNAWKTCQENFEKLGIVPNVKAVRANISGWLDNNSDRKFDLIFVDPPYDNINEEHIKRISQSLKPDGVMILSWPSGRPHIELDNLEIVLHKPLGDIHLSFYRA